MHVVRLGDALVHRLHENVVKLFVDGYLRVLQLGKRVNHHGIVEVILHHAFKKTEVVCRELANAVVQGLCDFCIRLSFSIYDLLDVVFTLTQVKAELT
jgi:hypothetical protein